MTAYILSDTLSSTMKVADVMSKGIITIDPKAGIREVSKIIFRKKIKSLPVVDKTKHLLGIVTRENLLERMYPDYRTLFENGDSLPDIEDLEKDIGTEITGLTALDIMTKRVIYTHDDTPLLRALSRMIVRRVNQLPVLSRKGVLIGMVTKGDIFYSMFKKKLT